MEPEVVKEKFNWKRLFITIAIVVSTSVVVGGVVWYMMDLDARDQKESQDRIISNLEAKIEELEESLEDEDSQTAFDVEVRAEMREIQTSLEIYYVEFMKYPDNLEVDDLYLSETIKNSPNFSKLTYLKEDRCYELTYVSGIEGSEPYVLTCKQ